jgi:hypothetical protein
LERQHSIENLAHECADLRLLGGARPGDVEHLRAVRVQKRTQQARCRQGLRRRRAQSRVSRDPPDRSLESEKITVASLSRTFQSVRWR